jgi:small Trp-rich protein
LFADWIFLERTFMLFLILAMVLMALKLMEIGPVAAWEWWWVLSPLGGAVIWWWWADATGYTKRTEMKREKQRADARKAKQREALGMGIKKKR